MLTTYKEIVYGAVFGFIALLLDTIMDAKSEGLGFLAEVALHPGMMLYRFLFIFFGVLIGRRQDRISSPKSTHFWQDFWHP